MIYTSYFANMKNFPPNVHPVSIARWQPKWLKDSIPVCSEIAPTIETLSGYKNGTINDELYDKEYKEKVLLKRTPEEFLSLLEQKTEIPDIANNKEEHIVLLCYEKDGFCHRNLFADYMREHGIMINELAKEDIEKSLNTMEELDSER